MALSETPAEGEPSTAELAQQIKDLKAAQVIEAPPVRVKAAPRLELVRRKAPAVSEQQDKIEQHEPGEDARPQEGTDGEGEGPGSLFSNHVRRKSVQRSLF